jgi:hypothetical protein
MENIFTLEFNRPSPIITGQKNNLSQKHILDWVSTLISRVKIFFIRIKNISSFSRVNQAWALPPVGLNPCLTLAVRVEIFFIRMG